MHRRLIVACLLFACSTAVADEKLDDVKKKISERAAKHSSVQYKMKMVSDMNQAGMEMKTEYNADIKYMKKEGDKFVSRMESDSVMSTKGGGQDMKYETKALSVCDGTYTWSLTEQMGQKMVSKSKVDENQRKMMSPDSGWEHFDIKLLPDEKAEGRDCWVLEMVPKQAATREHVGKTVSYYCKETGLPVKNVSYDAAGKVNGTMTVSEIKVNEKIDPKMFEFTPPEGVPVQDMTNLPNNPQTPQG